MFSVLNLNTDRDKESVQRLRKNTQRKQGDNPRLCNSYLWVFPRLLGISEVIFHCML